MSFRGPDRFRVTFFFCEVLMNKFACHFFCTPAGRVYDLQENVHEDFLLPKSLFYNYTGL